MMTPPLPGTSWLPTRTPSSTTHLPPDVFLLTRLWPVLAETFQPVRSLPLKMGTNPSSLGFSSAADRGPEAVRRRPRIRGTVATIRPRDMGRLPAGDSDEGCQYPPGCAGTQGMGSPVRESVCRRHSNGDPSGLGPIVLGPSGF